MGAEAALLSGADGDDDLAALLALAKVVLVELVPAVRAPGIPAGMDTVWRVANGVADYSGVTLGGVVHKPMAQGTDEDPALAVTATNARMATVGARRHG